jgi:hypothetical protein
MRENKDGSWYNLPKTISKHTIFLKQFENILGKLYVENHDPRLSSWGFFWVCLRRDAKGKRDEECDDVLN